MTDARPLVPVLVGSTAVGKTAVAAALAARKPITVISADARQIYRELDVGTAKPDATLLASVPHRGLSLVGPGERYSAGRFARDAAGWVTEAVAGGRLPVVVGGTGFYVRALVDGLFREPALDSGRRERLQAWTWSLAQPDLARWAARLDPTYGGGGRQRAARVVEMALLTGRTLSWWQHHARDTGVLIPWYIHLTLPRDVLHRRIAERVDRMLAAGLVDEVRRVLGRGVTPDAPGLDAVGYRQVMAMLAGCLPEAELRQAIIVATRRYAKRQATWFRHQLRPQTSDVRHQTSAEVWTLDATGSPESLAAAIQARWCQMRADV
jgi:tRNA dimethylallyltransferase